MPNDIRKVIFQQVDLYFSHLRGDGLGTVTKLPSFSQYLLALWINGNGWR